MTKSFTLDKPKRSEGWAKFQEWNRKWNRILASIFCILCFILLFAIVIVNIIETKEIHMEKSTSAIPTDYDEKMTTITSMVDENYDGKRKSFSIANTSVKGSCTISDCVVQCNHDVLETVNEEIEHIYVTSEASCSEIKLRLYNYNSTTGTLYKDWYKLPHHLKSLGIHGSHFEAIEDYAFNGSQFKRIESFMLTQLLSLKKIYKNAFVSLESVIEVHFETFPVISEIEAGVMTLITSRLRSFLVQGMPRTLMIGNMTGSQYISSSIVDLGYNNFGNTIMKNSFSGLTNVQSLFLWSSNIMSLPSGVFDRLTQLELINLNNNLLQTVPSGLFNTVVLKTLQLGVNNFNCICNEGILYLQEYARTYPARIKEDIICSAPDETTNELLQNVEIDCAPITGTTNFGTKSDLETTLNMTTSTEDLSSTESTTTTTKSSEPENEIYFNCENHTNVQMASYELPISIEARSIEFKIIKDSNFDIFVELVKEYTTDLTLLWFTNNAPIDSILSAVDGLSSTESTDVIEYKCAEHIKPLVKIENLRQNTLYIFCIVDQNDGRVLPFNCAAIRLVCDSPTTEIIPESQNNYDETWIYKSDKVMAIAIISASMILALLSGALIMYCCLRRFPFFVTNTKPRKTSRPWLQEQEEITEYHAPPNYITPSPARRSTKIGAERPSTLNTRRFSDTSVGSARSYVSAVTPSPFDIISFRMNNNKQKFRMSSNKSEATYDEARDNILYLDKFPDVPPPLPPHPNRRSNQSNLSSNQSTNSSTSSDPLFSISYRVQHDPDQCHTKSYA